MAYYFPKNPIKLDYIYFHTGRLVVMWAEAESAIDACLAVFAMAFPDPAYQPPRSTKRRITAFKKGLSAAKIDPKIAARGEDIISRFSQIADHRHWVAHGTSTYDTWQTKCVHVVYTRRDLSDGTHVERTYDLAKIEQLGDECLKLWGDIWDWLTTDLGASTPKKTEKAARKIGMKLPRKLPVRKQT